MSNTHFKTAVSLEHLSYQADDPVVGELVSAITRLRLDGTYTTKAVNESNIAEIINKRFGLNTLFKVYKSTELNAYAEIPHIDGNHPFFQVYTANRMGRLISELGVMGKNVGTIDLDKAKCGGIFNRIPVEIGVSSGLLSCRNMTSRQVVSILLHEIGHLFFYYLYLLHDTLGNYVSNFVAAKVAGASNDNERRVIITKGAEILGIDNVSVETVLQHTPEQVAGILQTIYIANTRNTIRSETGTYLYDKRACEQLADWFAGRFGMTTDLAHALSVMYRGQSPRSSIIATRALVGSLLVAGTLLTLGLGFLVVLWIAESGKCDDIRIYDKPKERLETLRRYHIQNLKDGANKEQLKTLLDEIKELDKIIDKIHDEPSLSYYLATKVLPFTKSVKNQIEFQKQVESLLFNDVYIRAAQFKTLSQ